MISGQLFPGAQPVVSHGVTPLVAVFETAGSSDGLQVIVDAAKGKSPSLEQGQQERTTSPQPQAQAQQSQQQQQQQQQEQPLLAVQDDDIPSGLGEGFSILHGMFKTDMCAKAAHAEVNVDESVYVEKDFVARVHEVISCLGQKNFREELTWSSLDAQKTNDFLRGLRWRVLLGALPADHRTWAGEVRWQREEYSRLREIFSFTKIVPPQPPLLAENGTLKPAKLVNTRDLELFVNYHTT